MVSSNIRPGNAERLLSLINTVFEVLILTGWCVALFETLKYNTEVHLLDPNGLHVGPSLQTHPLTHAHAP